MGWGLRTQGLEGGGFPVYRRFPDPQSHLSRKCDIQNSNPETLGLKMSPGNGQLLPS